MEGITEIYMRCHKQDKDTEAYIIISPAYL